jgi:hypothetical protein
VCGGLLNDMVVDASGRAFVGDFGTDVMGGGAPAFYEHTRAPVREAVLVSTQVAVPHAGLP